MMSFQDRFKSGDRPASGRAADPERTADKMSRFHRISWREVIGKIASPAFRLHRYRSAHNRLLQSAWCELDSRDARDCSA